MRNLYIFLGMFFVILISGCSDRPEEVREEIWNQGMQIAIYQQKGIDEGTGESGEYNSLVTNKVSSWKEIEDLTKEENEIIENLASMQIFKVYSDLAALTGEENDIEKPEAFVKLEEIYGAGNLKASKFDEVEFEKLMKEQETVSAEQSEEDRKDFRRESGAYLTAKEVQYDMSNNLDEKFWFEGSVELCDYYNYGYTNESNYFCGEVTPLEGDSWYIYFHRSSFEEVYKRLMDVGSINARIAATVLGDNYDSNQGNMAKAEAAEWGIILN